MSEEQPDSEEWADIKAVAEAKNIKEFVQEWEGIPSIMRSRILSGLQTPDNQTAIKEAKDLMMSVLWEEMEREGNTPNSKEGYDFDFAPFDFYTGEQYPLPIVSVRIKDISSSRRIFFPNKKIEQEFQDRKLFRTPNERPNPRK